MKCPNRPLANRAFGTPLWYDMMRSSMSLRAFIFECLSSCAEEVNFRKSEFFYVSFFHVYTVSKYSDNKSCSSQQTWFFFYLFLFANSVSTVWLAGNLRLPSPLAATLTTSSREQPKAFSHLTWSCGCFIRHQQWCVDDESHSCCHQFWSSRSSFTSKESLALISCRCTWLMPTCWPGAIS